MYLWIYHFASPGNFVLFPENAICLLDYLPLMVKVEIEIVLKYLPQIWTIVIIVICQMSFGVKYSPIYFIKTHNLKIILGKRFLIQYSWKFQLKKQK